MQIDIIEIVWVFVIGGIICIIGQILMDTTQLTAPRILVLFVVVGGILGGLGLYEPIVHLAKNGATVPLPGFGYSLVRGALKGLESDGFLGILTGGIKETAAGISVALVFGYIIALCFNPKSKAK